MPAAPSALIASWWRELQSRLGRADTDVMDVLSIAAASSSMATARLGTQVGASLLRRALDTEANAVAALLDRALPPSASGLGERLDIRL